jgi:hypothetical protein
MEISMTREKLSYAENVLRETRVAEESAELIVPDALPDILRIVGTDAEITVRSKETFEGRACVSGAARVAVIYVPDGGGAPRRMNAELPFTITAEDRRITPSCRVTARVEPRSVSAAAVNPRKIAARAAIAAEIMCFGDAELEIPVGITPECGDGIELLSAETELCLPVDILEKTFTVNDEHQIPASLPPIGELLNSRVVLSAGDARVVGSKLIFKGTASVALLYAPPDGSDLLQSAFETEFSQILELENADGNSEFEIIPLLTSARVENTDEAGADGRRVLAELRIAAQCVARARKTLRYVCDAYCSKYALEAPVAPLSFENSLGARAVSAVLRGTLNAEGASRVISVAARPGAVAATRENGALTLTCPVETEALYIDAEGGLRRADDCLELTATLPETGENVRYSARAECPRDIYGVAADGAIELRIPVELRADLTETRECGAVSALATDEASPLENAALPSLVLTRVMAGDSLWSLAKRHHSTRELILAANNRGADDELTCGDMLVIPKKR